MTKTATFIIKIVIVVLMVALLTGALVYYNAIDKVEDLKKPGNTGNVGNVSVGNFVGDLCPTYDLKNVYGDGTTNIESLRGKVVVINFWYTTCGPCVAELPYFNQLANEYDGQVEVVIVHAAFDFETTAPYLDNKYPNTKMIAVFDEAVPNKDDYYYKQLGGKSTYPMTIILNSEGVITHSIKKSISGYAELEGYVKDALTK